MSCEGCGGKIVHGAVGLAKVGAQFIGVDVDAVPPAVMQDRRDICRTCDEATKVISELHLPHKGLTTLSACRLCSCNIAAKSRLASESCPIGKWAAFDPAAKANTLSR